VHHRRVDSTNAQARLLAGAGAPHGTLVTASEQTAGRGRQGRSWSAPAGRALLMSLLLRDPPPLLSLLAGLAVCDAVRASGAAGALVKWPNDVVLAAPSGELGKVAGILVEGRPQEGWAVLGIGVNVAVNPDDLPPEVAGRAASLGLAPTAVEAVLAALLEALATRLGQPTAAMLEDWREVDALRGREVRWAGGPLPRAGYDGVADGVDAEGRLVVVGADGSRTALEAGEVHLGAEGVA
jgi:BirA family biotin operon repressor/biotin-[acetyl-CoA-carboxylase] ligase